MNSVIIFKKLRLFPAQKNLIVNAPVAFTALLTGTPFDAQVVPEKSGGYDCIAVLELIN